MKLGAEARPLVCELRLLRKVLLDAVGVAAEHGLFIVMWIFNVPLPALTHLVPGLHDCLVVRVIIDIQDNAERLRFELEIIRGVINGVFRDSLQPATERSPTLVTQPQQWPFKPSMLMTSRQRVGFRHTNCKAKRLEF